MKELSKTENDWTISNGLQAPFDDTMTSETVLRNRLIKNTYLLLSMTLMFSAACAGVAMMYALPHPGVIITVVGYIGLMLLTVALRNSALGLVSVFALTGFMGYTLGPIVSAYLTLPNGQEIVMQALAGTAIVFVGLSLYAFKTRKDFSYMGGFLAVGALVAFVAGLAALFFDIPALSLTVSAAFALISAGFILHDTSRIVNGGETNYIMATVSLYVSIFNLFVSLLRLLAASKD